MSQPQYPPQQPEQPQPGYGAAPQPPYSPNTGWAAQPTAWGMPPVPQPPKKRGIGKILGIGCAGVVGLFVVIIIIAAVAGGGSSKGSSSVASDSKPTAAATKDAKGSTPASSGKAGNGGGSKANSDDGKSSGSDTAVFKVWGTAPAGDLGPLDITYGSDSDTRKGHFADGKFEASLPVTKGATYEQVMAQLQGSGDIHCSITIGGKTKTGHASGGYNICSAQLSGGLFGDWE